MAPLGVRPLIIPDETRYAEIPREMINSGDWIRIRLNGLRYYEKPAMGYWLNALSISVFGENEFAVRFPSALSAGLSALIVFLLASRFNGGLTQGATSAAIYLTFIQVFGIGVFSVLDSMLSFFITACLGAFHLGWRLRQSLPRHRFWLAVTGVLCGLAFLTKGFIGIVVPAVVIAPFMIWENQWRAMLKTAAVIGGAAVLTVLPWGLLIHWREPGFWDFFFWNEHIRRFMAPNAQHKQHFLFYLALLPLCLFPWTVLVPAALAGLKHRLMDSSLFRYSFCWILFPFLFFSVCSGKIVTYILPCFPPLALVMGSGLTAYFKTGRTALFNAGTIFLSGIAAVLVLSLIVAQTGLINGFIAYSALWKAVLFMVSLLVFFCLLLATASTPDAGRKLGAFAAAPVLIYCSTHFLVPDLTLERKSPGSFFLQNKAAVTNDTLIVSQGSLIQAVCWYFKRSDVYQMGQGGELSYGLEQPDSIHRLLTPDQFNAIVDQRKATSSGRADVVLIMDATKERLWANQIRQPLIRESDGHNGYILTVY